MWLTSQNTAGAAFISYLYSKTRLTQHTHFCGGNEKKLNGNSDIEYRHIHGKRICCIGHKLHWVKRVHVILAYRITLVGSDWNISGYYSYTGS